MNNTFQYAFLAGAFLALVPGVLAGVEGASRVLKNVASGLQSGAPGAQEPECTEGVHEDSEHRASPNQGRAVVFQQPARSRTVRAPNLR